MRMILMLTTVGDEEQGNLLASELVARRLAACVNLVPGVRSTYRWQGKVCRDSEILLIIKTLASERDAVEAAISELHSYELPEIVAIDALHAEAAFLQWVAGSLDKQADFDDDEESPDP